MQKSLIAASLIAAGMGLGGCASAPEPKRDAGAEAGAVLPPPTDVTAPAAPPPGASLVPEIEWGMVIHGGAGTIRRGSMTTEVEARYRAKMSEALRAGHAVLAAGGSSVAAVEAAINVMEDSPLFNSGRGAVFTGEGTNTLDASIMDGATLQAGAVAGVTRVRNPISLARLVMERSPHVMLAGAGAEAFARLQGVELVDPSYFFTESRWRSLQRARERAGEPMPPLPAGVDTAVSRAPLLEEDKFGTVGAVALDREGNIAAGTSTGGMTNKKWGRIGDSPVIGAGTYAGENCGVSSTGWGEFYIRNVAAYDVCARMKYKNISLYRAARQVIFDVLEAQEPDTGGIIALDGDGNVVTMMNTSGMYRGYIDEHGEINTAIYD